MVFYKTATMILHIFTCSRCTTILYIKSVDTGIIPNLCKTSTVIHVPKLPSPQNINHYRPVALTSVPVKAQETLILTNLSPHIQFAYNYGRSTDDAVATMEYNVPKHLEKAGNYILILFIDFSSAFNTIQHHKMIEKLLALQIPPTSFTGCITFSATDPNM